MDNAAEVSKSKNATTLVNASLAEKSAFPENGQYLTFLLSGEVFA